MCCFDRLGAASHSAVTDEVQIVRRRLPRPLHRSPFPHTPRLRYPTPRRTQRKAGRSPSDRPFHFGATFSVDLVKTTLDLLAIVGKYACWRALSRPSRLPKMPI